MTRAVVVGKAQNAMSLVTYEDLASIAHPTNTFVFLDAYFSLFVKIKISIIAITITKLICTNLR